MSHHDRPSTSDSAIFISDGASGDYHQPAQPMVYLDGDPKATRAAFRANDKRAIQPELNDLTHTLALANDADAIHARLMGDEGFKSTGHLSPESLKKIEEMMAKHPEEIKELEAQVNQVLNGKYQIHLDKSGPIQNLQNGHLSEQYMIQSVDAQSHKPVATQFVSHDLPPPPRR